jgi:ribosomal protein L37AE/L43A
MIAVRRNRLAVRACPGCAQETLVSNGAFWVCGGCRYAATSMALAMDCAPADKSMNAPRASYRRDDRRQRFAEDSLQPEPAYTAR